MPTRRTRAPPTKVPAIAATPNAVSATPTSAGDQCSSRTRYRTINGPCNAPAIAATVADTARGARMRLPKITRSPRSAVPPTAPTGTRRLTDQVRRHRRHDVRRRIEEDRERCSHQLHQKPGHRRSGRRRDVHVEQCALFARIRSSRGTSAGSNVFDAVSDNNVSTPVSTATTYSCHICNAPTAAASWDGPEQYRRPTSVTTSTRRSDHRSTQTPAGSPKTRCGAQSALPVRPSPQLTRPASPQRPAVARRW